MTCSLTLCDMLDILNSSGGIIEKCNRPPLCFKMRLLDRWCPASNSRRVGGTDYDNTVILITIQKLV